jgi:fatty acid desaturase
MLRVAERESLPGELIRDEVAAGRLVIPANAHHERLNALTLGWSFDYLPHCRLESQEEAGRFRTTRNRVGWEWLMTPLMLYQNYHLVHHLHPVVPFYRYLSVWRLRECQYLDRDPALSTIRGRPLSAGEYRRLRALEH